ncbi:MULTISPECIES: carbon-nitrogen hydrolase family protein [Sphingopyxis]|uniref:carbon-nitrogen hydrolase family protein n=1 Tax=Sphingopyxis TaxID=165697 RepID=UPI001445F043|nr:MULTISPECIES: carbon-nitrogen hydrolase family protein [Sphingopyxis]USI77675.1 carbon-nitrogen hydrolase family protein [Sphingopyxis sp. USTB-05]
MVSPFRIAAAQYPIEALASWEAYADKLTRWVGEAAEGGASLLVFPEYGAMELVSLEPATMGDLQGSIAFVAALLPEVDALHAELAARFGVHILAASAPWQAPDGRFRNRARLFTPGGMVGVQDKFIMTRFEREEGGIVGGDSLNLFDTALGRIGVCICYDSEFPLIARALVEAGAEILLVPSCTDSLHGYHRVRIGSQARALEGQCYTVQSPTVGTADWSPAVDVNRGAAAVYGPPDCGFPEDGVIAQGVLDQPGWVYAEVDLAAVGMVREDGSVLNVAHWQEQCPLDRAPDTVVISCH